MFGSDRDIDLWYGPFNPDVVGAYASLNRINSLGVPQTTVRIYVDFKDTQLMICGPIVRDALPGSNAWLFMGVIDNLNIMPLRDLVTFRYAEWEDGVCTGPNPPSVRSYATDGGNVNLTVSV